MQKCLKYGQRGEANELEEKFTKLKKSKEKFFRRLKVRLLPTWKRAWVSGKSGKGIEIKMELQSDC